MAELERRGSVLVLVDDDAEGGEGGNFASAADFDAFVTTYEKRATELREAYSRATRIECDACGHQDVAHASPGGCTVEVPVGDGGEITAPCGCTA